MSTLVGGIVKLHLDLLKDPPSIGKILFRCQWPLDLFWCVPTGSQRCSHLDQQATPGELDYSVFFFFFGGGGDDGCGHLASDTQASEFGFVWPAIKVVSSSPPSTQMPPLPPHPSQLQQMSAGNVEARVSENPDSPEYLGMRSPGLHKRLLGVLRRSSWVYFSWPSQLCVHLWLIHVSKCRLSQQALRILNRHQHLFCVAIRHSPLWLWDAGSEVN